MINLDGLTPLRESQNYKIFQHPELEGALLKVRCDEPKRDHLIRRYSERRYGNLRQWQREANEYLAALHRGCPEIERLARFMGYEPTSLGPALVVEKMTGPDGNLAPSVHALMQATAHDPAQRKRLLEEVIELLDDLERGRIVVGDMGFENIVRAQERGGRLVVIDGLGERVLLPLTLISDWAFRQSIARRRARLAG